MRNVSGLFYSLHHLASTLLKLSADAGQLLLLCLRPSPALAAEVLFLRKQLALYGNHQVKPRRATNATRLALVWFSRWFDWRPVLRIVKPETFMRWLLFFRYICSRDASNNGKSSGSFRDWIPAG
jgi:hypothetical protein